MTQLNTIAESRAEQSRVIVVGDLFQNGHNSMAGRVYDVHGIAPTLGASHFQQIKYVLVAD